VDELGVARIGHACAAAQDPALVKRLARDGIAIEVCLSSNYHTGAVKRGARHPLETFLQAGVPVRLGTGTPTSIPDLDVRNEAAFARGFHQSKVDPTAIEQLLRRPLD
jgi:adenosine deaminase